MQSSPRALLPTVGRMLLGVIWIAGAIFNAVWTLPSAFDVWEGLADDATFGVYRWFFGAVVGAAPDLMTLLLIVGELTLGVLLLARDPWARAGAALSVVWCLFLLFLIMPYTLTTLPLLALAAWLLRYDHEQSAIDLLRHRGVHDHLHRVGV